MSVERWLDTTQKKIIKLFFSTREASQRLEWWWWKLRWSQVFFELVFFQFLWTNLFSTLLWFCPPFSWFLLFMFLFRLGGQVHRNWKPCKRYQLRYPTSWEVIYVLSLNFVLQTQISFLRWHLCCRGKEDKDSVVLYFDSWPREDLCIVLPLKQVDMREP